VGLYTQGNGTYVSVGNPASQESNTPGNANGIVSTGAPDPSLFKIACPMDGLLCRIVGSQTNCWRCDNGHQWTMSGGYLINQPYVFDNKIAPVVVTTIPVTLG